MKINYCILLLLVCSISLFSLTGFDQTPKFSINDETLPVTLSSFLAVPNATNHSITINWTTQSESNLVGYNIFRGETDLLSSSTKITFDAIPATNSQIPINYSFADDMVIEEITYYYWLQTLEYNNSEFFGPVSAMLDNTDDDNGINEIVLGNDIYANYPNPFNPSTTISYSIAQASDVTIDVFNIKGQRINRLFSGYVQDVNKKRSIIWDGNDSAGNHVASGIYFAQIKTTSFSKTTKMLLTK